MADDAGSGSGNGSDRREELPAESPVHDQGELAGPSDGNPPGSWSAGEPGRECTAGDRHAPGGHRGSGLYPLARSGFIEYDRILFFSDAVFAIAVTLLAVDLRVPIHPAGTAHELHLALPGLRSFAISFLVVGLFWLGHHGMFRYITAFDRPLIGLNLLFLGTIPFLPYPTGLLSADQDAGAVIFYAVCAAAAGLSEGAVWLYATRSGSGLADPSVSRVRLQPTLRITRVPVVFLASIPVAFVAPEVAQYFLDPDLDLGHRDQPPRPAGA